MSTKHREVPSPVTPHWFHPVSSVLGSGAGDVRDLKNKELKVASKYIFLRQINKCLQNLYVLLKNYFNSGQVLLILFKVMHF